MIAAAAIVWFPVRRSRRLLVFVRTPGNSQHGHTTIMVANQASAAAIAVVVPIVVVCFFMA